MPDIQWRTFKSYAGPLIEGTIEFQSPARKDYHIDRAFWLTAKVETGARFGSVMAYDGTGMTAGLDQHIAVYPKELSKPDDGNALDDQGTLWKLLRRIEMIPDQVGPLEVLWRNLQAAGWYLAPDGVLRDTTTGEPINGRLIRNQFTPKNGKPTTPEQKEEAKRWALLFYNLFSNPYTFKAQIEYGIEHLVKRTTRRQISVGGKLQSVSVFYGRELTILKLDPDWTEDKDLAMCMYQAHSVNAPAIANKALANIKTTKGDWPKRLIHILGTSKYGRWDDDIKYGRYQRTRLAAKASGLWSSALFDGKTAIMPKDIMD
jgi:hypothetical protein